MNELDETMNRNSERASLPMERTFFGDMDKACVDHIAEAYRHFVPEERIAAMRELPTVFENRGEFVNAYERVSETTPEKNVSGFSRGLESKAHVSIDSLSDVSEITMHERIHQASHSDAERILGTPMYEGITQDLTIEQIEREPEPGELTGYPEERRAAHLLREVCGDPAIENAYFRGNASDLKICLDQNLGETSEMLRERMKTWEDARRKG